MDVDVLPSLQLPHSVLARVEEHFAGGLPHGSKRFITLLSRASEGMLARSRQEDAAMTWDPNELPPPMLKDPQYVPPPRDTGRPGPHIVAEIIPLEGQLKAGHVQGFTVRCDESERVGGMDSAPSPLGYFTVAVGF